MFDEVSFVILSGFPNLGALLKPELWALKIQIWVFSVKRQRCERPVISVLNTHDSCALRCIQHSIFFGPVKLRFRLCQSRVYGALIIQFWVQENAGCKPSFLAEICRETNCGEIFSSVWTCPLLGRRHQSIKTIHTNYHTRRNLYKVWHNDAVNMWRLHTRRTKTTLRLRTKITRLKITNSEIYNLPATVRNVTLSDTVCWALGRATILYKNLIPAIPIGYLVRCVSDLYGINYADHEKHQNEPVKQKLSIYIFNVPKIWLAVHTGMLHLLWRMVDWCTHNYIQFCSLALVNNSFMSSCQSEQVLQFVSTCIQNSITELVISKNINVLYKML